MQTARDLLAIPPEQLTDSPTNPRRRFDDLDELTASVAKQGVLQPILARPDGNGGYQIVCGHRRCHAAKGAGLATVPVVICHLTDREAVEAQLTENLQRNDIHTLEEADGYHLLHTQHGYSVDEIADKVGKSRAYVYARMKLTALQGEARDLFEQNQLTPSVALLIARIPDAELQAKAAADCSKEDSWDGRKMSAREAGRHIQSEYMLRLKTASWKLDDAELVPDAGACKTCPKRTGNDPELFGDVESADVCTDPPCFKSKQDAAWANKAEAARKRGRTVVEGEDAKKAFSEYGGDRLRENSQFVQMSSLCFDDSKCRSYNAVLKGKDKPRTVLIQAPSGKPLEVVRRTDLNQALKAAGVKTTAPAVSSSRPRQQRELDDRVTAAAVGEIVAKAEKAKIDVELFRRLAATIVHHDHWRDTIPDTLRRRHIEVPKGQQDHDILLATIKTMSRGELVGLCVEVLARDEFPTHPASLKTQCKVWGVNLQTVRSRQTKAAAAERKARGKKKASKKKKPNATSRRK